MKKVFENPSNLENLVKENLHFPPFVMMENAASALCQKVTRIWDASFEEDSDFDPPEAVLIFCGKGNNGADGLALARKLAHQIPVFVYCPVPPSTEEGTVQYTMAVAAGVPFTSRDDFFSLLRNSSIIVDCLYGTGFHGNLDFNDSLLLDEVNRSPSIRIACDIPSALIFKADYTITMGSLKSVLFSDKAKEVAGQIIVSDLGISRELFESFDDSTISLVEEQDICLPLRLSRNTHKGKFGHTAIIAGEKSGAAILAGEAALHFGSGLTSLIRTPFDNLNQFKISPALMLADNFPAKTTAALVGSGLGSPQQNSQVAKLLMVFDQWFSKQKNPACVVDADILSSPGVAGILYSLNNVPNARIVITPHAKELSNIAHKFGITSRSDAASTKLEDSTPMSPEEALERRIEIGQKLNRRLPGMVIVMKGANTFIAHDCKTYIVDSGCQSLAKGGSGDVLAGMITSLLAQGYTALDAALTATFRHGQASYELGSEDYSLTAEKLIEII